MAIQAGLVGLPNVGKSTLFNALTKSSVPAQNYPFCTVDPHMAITYVPDKRLEKLVQIFKSQKIVPTTVQFTDIAGLVKGAAQGEGLGNQFLGNIMNVDLILHIVRCFEDSNVTHVYNEINPIKDLEIIFAELMLKDLESIEKRDEKIAALLKGAKSRNLTSQEIKDLENENNLLQEIKRAVQEGNINKVQSAVKNYKQEGVQTIPLLSAKNFLIIANLSEQDIESKNYLGNSFFQSLVDKFGKEIVIPICAKIEFELAQLSDAEKIEMLDSLNMKQELEDLGEFELSQLTEIEKAEMSEYLKKQTGLDVIIRKTYSNLGLITFFTCGPKESHAWTIKRGTKVINAAGEIHSDLERGFICAEVYNCRDLFKTGNEQALRVSGKIRTEGKDYIVQDGDLLNIRFNV
jgi:ribosome-binding ATPase